MLSLEYIAGFFDGEGSIRINYKGYYNKLPSSLDVRIGQNLKVNAVLHEVCAMFGGTVIDYKNGYSQWVVTTTKAATFLKTIEPHLYIKREEALLAIQYQTYLDSQGQVRGKKLTEWQLAERLSYYEALMENRYGDSFSSGTLYSTSEVN